MHDRARRRIAATRQGGVIGAGSRASIGGLVPGGLLYPALGGHLFRLAAGLFGLVLTPIWFARSG